MNATWMKTLFEAGGDPNIWELNLVGSHHSAVLWNDLYVHDAIESQFSKYKTVAPMVPFIFRCWTVCQDRTILDQLKMGVRYLSLNISFTNGAFYVTHSYRGPLLTTVLDQIVEFYEMYGTSEIILLRAAADSENRKTLRGREKELMHVFNDHKVSQYYTDHTSQRLFMRLSEYGDKPLIPLFDHEIQCDDIGHPNFFFRKWYNANTNDQLFQKMETGFNYIKDQNIANISVIQSILTPSVQQIVFGILIWIYFFVTGICSVGIGIILSVEHNHLTPCSTFLETQKASVAFLSIFSVIIVGFSIVMMCLRPAISIKHLSVDTKLRFLEQSNDKAFNVVLVDFVDPEFVENVITLNDRHKCVEI